MRMTRDFGTAVRERMDWYEKGFDWDAHAEAIEDLRALIHDWDVVYTNYVKSEAHVSDFRCVARYGRAIKDRYATGA